MASGFVIAVDGPAASGKGTIAGRLATIFGLAHLDTGLLYRAVGCEAGDADAPGLEARAVAAARALEPAWLERPALRSREAGELASRVAVFPAVREVLFGFQRRFVARPGGAVVDGRDIGAVIAPDAAAKLFVTARSEVRAERRWRQLAAQGEAATLDEVLDDIRRRDARDTARAASPLVQAADAVLLDTSEMDISTSAEAARRLVETARARWDPSRSG